MRISDWSSDVCSSDLALYATPEQRPLHDVVTCIREGVTVARAGRLLAANAERYLKSPKEMARLFRDCPAAVTESAPLLSRIRFSLEDLQYEYISEERRVGKESFSTCRSRYSTYHLKHKTNDMFP